MSRGLVSVAIRWNERWSSSGCGSPPVRRRSKKMASKLHGRCRSSRTNNLLYVGVPLSHGTNAHHRVSKFRRCQSSSGPPLRTPRRLTAAQRPPADALERDIDYAPPCPIVASKRARAPQIGPVARGAVREGTIDGEWLPGFVGGGVSRPRGLKHGRAGISPPRSRAH
jgi:hypothetical protein